MEAPSSINKLGLHTAVSIVVGSIIGSGVFMKPATMAAQTGSGWALVMVWVIGGLLSLCGAIIFAELSAMFPETGGLYVYLRKMYGDFIAFLYGWAGFTVINTASVAAIAFVCASYANYFLQLPSFEEALVQRVVWHIPGIGSIYPLKDAGIKALAILLVLSLTWLNAFSLKASGKLQLISTLAKVAVIIALVAGILFSGNGDFSNIVSTGANAPQGMQLLKGCMAALTGAFVAYDGWQNITFMGSEVANPQKNLPKSIVLGVLSCMVVYVLINIAYAYALPQPVMASSALVASDAIAAMLGRTSGAVIAALVVIVTFGSVNGNVMSTARVSVAMGQDKLFFPAAGVINARTEQPSNALWLHSAWIVLLIISGSFDMLADMFVFITWVFIIIACVGLAILRIKSPHASRPYKMWGYPFLLIIFCAFACYYVYSVLDYEIQAYHAGKIPVVNSLLGISITLTGIPLYLYFKRRYGSQRK